MVRPLASSYLLVDDDDGDDDDDDDDDGLRRPMSALLSEILGVAQIYVSSSFLFSLFLPREGL